MVFIPADSKRFKYRFRLAELPFPAVNQDHIRNFALFYGFTIATTQHLIHGRIVIARRDPGDVVAAILGAQWAIRIKHHAGGHRLFSHRVTDVETLHPFHFRKLQQRRQGR